MTIEQWNALTADSKEALIEEIFSQYMAAVHAEQNPNTDPIIKTVLQYVSLNGNTAYINIHKVKKIRFK